MNANSQKILTNSARRVGSDEREVAYDVVFVLNANSKGWILEKFCKIVEANSKLHYGYVYTERNDQITTELPKARAYFFAHYAIAYSTMMKHPQIFSADRYLWFTHPDPAKGIGFDELAIALNACTKVFCMNSGHRQLLELIGVAREKISLAFGGADPKDFQPHARGAGKVGFVGAYYERKNPDKMLDLIRAMPDINFILVAPDALSVENKDLLWPAWSRFKELLALPNLTYVEVPYEEYPSYFAQMDVYVSLSRLEGGPIPVLEAMMANVVPVATRTGFANDVIISGENGYIIEIDDDIDTIESTIRRALDDPERDIRASGLAHSWESFAEGVLRHVEEPAFYGKRVSLAGQNVPKTMLRDGWHPPEATGTWTSAPISSLSLRFREMAPGRKQITLYAWTVLASREDRRIVEVFVNGSRVIDYELRTESPARLKGSFYLGQDQIDSPIVITIQVSFPSDGDEPVVDDLLLLGASEVVMNQQPSFGIKLGWLQIEDFVTVQIAAGDEIGFGTGQAGEPLLLEGWHSTEENGVWTNGLIGTFTVPLDEECRLGRARLIVTGRALGAGRPGAGGLVASVMSETGDRPVIAKIKFRDEHFLSFAIPLKNIARSDNDLIVVLERERSFVPFELDPASNDRRDLGFFLQSMRLEHHK